MSEAVARPVRINDVADLNKLVGTPLPPSEWIEITQDMVNRFADVTLDRQWIHLDQERAKTGSYGATVAHGYLILSLGPHLVRHVLDLSVLRAGINYGADRIRFPAPTLVGSRVRLHVEILEAKPIGARAARTLMNYTFESDRGDRPVCVAQVLSQMEFESHDAR